MSAAEELQRAIYEALADDASLTALLGPERIHDGLKARTAMPCVVLGDMETTDWSADEAPGEEHRMRLIVHSDENGKRQAQSVMATVKAALHERALVLEGHYLVDLRLEETSLARVEKTRRHEGTMRFRALTEESGL